jgi:hypothetical protein
MAIADEADKALLRGRGRSLLLGRSQRVRARLGCQEGLGLQRLLYLQSQQLIPRLLRLK